jgi:hypothetical protein
MGAHTEQLAYNQWVELVNRQGWNEASQIIHLEGFIRAKGLMDEFVTYADECACEENAPLEDPEVIEPEDHSQGDVLGLDDEREVP